MSTEVKLHALCEALHQQDDRAAEHLFAELWGRVEGPVGGQLSQLLWNELTRTRRSLKFWQQQPASVLQPSQLRFLQDQ